MIGKLLVAWRVVLTPVPGADLFFLESKMTAGENDSEKKTSQKGKMELGCQA